MPILGLLHALRWVAQSPDEFAGLIERQVGVHRVGECPPLMVIRSGGVGIHEMKHRRVGVGVKSRFTAECSIES